MYRETVKQPGHFILINNQHVMYVIKSCDFWIIFLLSLFTIKFVIRNNGWMKFRLTGGHEILYNPNTEILYTVSLVYHKNFGYL